MESRGSLILKLALMGNTEVPKMSSTMASTLARDKKSQVYQSEVNVSENENEMPKMEIDSENLLRKTCDIPFRSIEVEVESTVNEEPTSVCENISKEIGLDNISQDITNIPSTSTNSFGVSNRPGFIDVTNDRDDSLCSLSDLEDEPFQDSGSSYHPGSDSEASVENASNIEKGCKRSLENIGDNIKDKKKKKKKSKKGEAVPDLWKRNKAKTLRMKGKNYEVIKKIQNGSKVVMMKNSRKMGERCDSKKCKNSKEKRQCHKISDDQRQALFEKFWSDMDWKQRKTFVATLVNKAPPVQKTTKKKSRRDFSLFYHLKINNVLVPVCKMMFLSTLALGEWSVLNWVKNSDSSGIISHVSSYPNKKRLVNEQKRSAIKSFFERLPKLPSHYCRASTSKVYLENIFHSYSEVYQLYKREVNEELICSMPVFVSVMRTLNIDIFQPRKDQCDLCCSFKQGNVSHDEYQQHIHAKDRARQEKCQDKNKALSGEVCTYTMDVQAVQLVPYLPAGMIYFKQKLACHNFTIYSLADDKVVCYVWHEGEGGLDANCFASCLTDFLENQVGEEDKNKTQIFFSDGCCAQNRNHLLSNALLNYSISKNVTIIQKYLVKGHTQMECDSVHSTIERAKKNKEIQSPSNYVQIIQQARKCAKGPYVVKYVDHTFFQNYEEIKYYSSIRPGFKKGDACVTDLRALKYSPEGIEYKINFDDEWSVLPRRKTGNVGSIDRLYDSPLVLKGDKYEHLQYLKSVMHKDYYGFYDSLNH